MDLVYLRGYMKSNGARSSCQYLDDTMLRFLPFQNTIANAYILSCSASTYQITCFPSSLTFYQKSHLRQPFTFKSSSAFIKCRLPTVCWMLWLYLIFIGQNLHTEVHSGCCHKFLCYNKENTDCGGQDIVAATLSESSKTVLEVMERLWKSGTVASSLLFCQ